MLDRSGSVAKDELKDFEEVIVVFGSRGFNDNKVFDHAIGKYLKDFDLDQETQKGKVVFVAGKTVNSVDALIVKWCQTNGYCWSVFEPNWDDIEVENAVVRYRNGRAYNALAGFWCNIEMAEISTRGISFYDGVSSNTQDMITQLTERNIPCRVILVETDSKEVTNNGTGQSQGSRSGHSEAH